ncbi:MAG: beta-propeller domain-containing protein [Propionibacteriaceae bacterium]|jgi:uncharacterized secreted protein with C-terminal beta-propeller domain|nr:beta-propeller domain-containing protein [Propionibacteriaceae bacterium]
MSDEFTEKIHGMRESLTPPPELISRVMAALEDQGQHHMVSPKAETSSTPTKVVKNRKPSAKPKTRRKGRLSILVGGATSVVLAALMMVPMPSGFQGYWDTKAGAYVEIYRAISSVLAPRAVYTSDVVFGTEAISEEAPVPGAAVPSAANDTGVTESTNTTSGMPESEAGASGTNTQVEGIDEGDIVKTDGANLYISRDYGIVVVSGEGAQSRQLSKINLKEPETSFVAEMMITGETLVILVQDYGQPGCYACEFSYDRLKAVFYDISDPVNPRYISEITQSGNYVTSRLSDGVMYLVSNYYVYNDIVAEDPSTYVPIVDKGDGPTPIPAGDVTILSWVNAPSYTVVTALDVDNATVMSEQSILGQADNVYMSHENLYLGSLGWPQYDSYTGKQLPWDEDMQIPGYDNHGGQRSVIVKMSLGQGHLVVKESGLVPGYLLSQFSLDESDGYLRIVTTWEDTSNGRWVPAAALWILDSSMKMVGSIPQLVTNETVRSVRFAGPVGYVVTFEQVDPLFTIDLSNPRDPRVQSALKIPGFSSYLHPFGDGLLLGIGSDGDESGLNGGLKLSMFDVSDPYDVSEVAVTKIEASDTEVSRTHKAAYVDLRRGTIGFPTVTWPPLGEPVIEAPPVEPTEVPTVEPTEPAGLVMPDMTGFSESATATKFLAGGFSLDSIRWVLEDSLHTPGSVIRTDPEPGTPVAADTIITVYLAEIVLNVGEDRFDPPSLIGLSHEQAEQILTDEGFTIEYVTVPNQAPAGEWLGTTCERRKEGVCQFYISEGPLSTDPDPATSRATAVPLLDELPSTIEREIWNYRIFTWDGAQFTPTAQMTLDGDHWNYARGVRIADFFYIATSNSVQVYEMDGYTELAKVVLS